MPHESQTDAAELLALLGDEYVQAILVAANEKRLSAKELSEELDVAQSTVYDRTDEMLDYQLLVERTQIMDDGSHHSVYETNLDHLDVDVEGDRLVVSVETRESPAQRFTDIWNDIRGV